MEHSVQKSLNASFLRNSEKGIIPKMCNRLALPIQQLILAQRLLGLKRLFRIFADRPGISEKKTFLPMRTHLLQ